MNTSQIVLAAALVAASLVVVLIIALASRHRKAALCDLDLVGAIASVETTLAPEGSVMVRGELWRARLRCGSILERGRMARVVGASDHLLEVEPTL